MKNAACRILSFTLLALSVFLASAVFIPPANAQNQELQEKVTFAKQMIAANQQKLHQYQWIETVQLTLKGDPKPQKQSLCKYAYDGTISKTPIGAPPPPPSGGRLKKRIIEKKTEEMQDYMGQVKSLLGMYVPPDPQKMGQAFAAGNASLNPSPGAGVTAIVFRNYAQPGDQMTLLFNSAAAKVTSLTVNTYMDNPQDTVTLTVQMSSLPDGTNYAQQTFLDATAKKLQVTTTNSDYQMIGAQ
jgi:hypothetical protein